MAENLAYPVLVSLEFGDMLITDLPRCQRFRKALLIEL
jgi:hypothetical protein